MYPVRFPDAAKVNIIRIELHLQRSFLNWFFLFSENKGTRSVIFHQAYLFFLASLTIHFSLFEELFFFPFCPFYHTGFEARVCIYVD